MESQTVFTTGQIAKICNVAPRTVSKWFDSGRLRGYRIPGSKDRRVPRENLIQFLKEHGMPLGELEDMAMGKVLIVDPSGSVLTQISGEFDKNYYRLESAGTAFETGTLLHSFHPDCVVIDLAVGPKSAEEIARGLRQQPATADVVLIAILDNAEQAKMLDLTLFNETFRRPYDATLLAERVRSLVQRKRAR